MCYFSFSEFVLSVKWCPLKQNKNIMKDCTGYVFICLLQGWIHWPHTCMYGLLHKVLMLHSKNWQHQLNTTINQLFLSHSVTGLQGIATLNGLELKSLVGIPIWNLVQFHSDDMRISGEILFVVVKTTETYKNWQSEMIRTKLARVSLKLWEELQTIYGICIFKYVLKLRAW